jgi:hypothetical protein
MINLLYSLIKTVGKGGQLVAPERFQRLRSYFLITLIFSLFGICQNLWASQEAVIIADSAIVYADKQMSAPVGYIAKGKKVRIGVVPRNRAQVYPIVVSGKIAYIRSLDVSPISDSDTPQRLMTERFSKQTQKKLVGSYSLSYFSYMSQVSLENENADLKDGGALNWNGLTLQGSSHQGNGIDFSFLFSGMTAKFKQETFNVFELGFGVSGQILAFERMSLKLEGVGMAIPFSNYAYKDDFRVNGYGYSVGGALKGLYRFSKTWGAEIYGGSHYTKLASLNAPKPYKQISPSFLGTKLGIGLIVEF